MKITSLIAIAVLASATAEAGPTGFEGHSFVTNKKFGVGLELGYPTGVNAKLFLTPSNALDFGIGEVYHDYYGGNGFHIYGDYLWHPAVLTTQPSFSLPFYVGVGARLWEFDYNYNCGGQMCNGASALGIRVPLGVTFNFNNVPLDLFVQAVPTLDFFNHYTHDFYLDIDFSVGVRFWPF
jgi:hypothetical protein